MHATLSASLGMLVTTLAGQDVALRTHEVLRNIEFMPFWRHIKGVGGRGGEVRGGRKGDRVIAAVNNVQVCLAVC